MTAPFIKLCVAAVVGLSAVGAAAKLPAPNLTPEAKAKAAEAAAKTAWSGKVADYQLCKSQDRAAGNYAARLKAGAVTAPPAGAGGAPTVTACADPGPFVYVPPEAAPAAAPAATAAAAPAPVKK